LGDVGFEAPLITPLAALDRGGGNPKRCAMADKIISDRAWKIIAEKGWVGFGLLGLALAIIGGSGKVQ